MKNLLVFVGVVGLLVVGCGKSEEASSSLEQRIEGLEGRLAAVEQSHRDLQTQLQKLEWQYAAIGPKLDALAAQGPAASREELERAVREALERQTADREARAREQRARWREQAAQRAARMRERQMDRLAEALELTDEQRDQVAALSEEVRAATQDAFAAMREQGAFDRDQMQQVMQEMRAKTEAGMKEILSDEQFEKYQALPERERGLGWGMPRPQGLGGERTRRRPVVAPVEPEIW